MKFIAAAAATAALAVPYAFAYAQITTQNQTPCRGTTLSGIVSDPTLALIPGATVTLDEGQSETSGSDGRFRFACLSTGPHRLSISASGFAHRDLSISAPQTSPIEILLQPEEVQTEVNVSGDAGASDATSSGAAQTISGSRLQSLADDPDDLLRELQQLASVGGGNPTNATIAVDGFQGTSTLPPKSSIAYIKVNPDQFSAEYREPPFDGGRVEIYTKPGQNTYHGALFLTNGSPWENARDPFSTSKASIGKQRYGFELSGPVRKKGSDFALALEHRSIDNFAVVNAITLNSTGAPISSVTNVATPERLWIGTTRIDWQLTPKNTFIASYSANVNHKQNVGVGGTSLAETGYDSLPYEHTLRFSNITTASAHFMHEARVSLRWDGETDTPSSNAPQVQVAGAFTGGGANIGPQHLREFNLEIDDDAILTTSKHTLKFGTQIMFYKENQRLTTNFNGTYTFGGGTAPVLDANGNPIPGQTTTISGLEQYRRAQLGLAGGNATAFSNVAGIPTVAFNQAQTAVFLQDDWNVGHGVHIAAGMRYFLQNHPTVLSLSSVSPRVGILWSPDSKGTWTLHAHYGLFSGHFVEGNQAEVQREDGILRVTSTIYNPVFNNPFSGAVPIHSIRRFAPHISNNTFGAANIGGTRTLPHGWNLSADYYFGRSWNNARSLNINSPLNNVPTGPRPGTPDLNILQVQSSGQTNVEVTIVVVEQHSYKRVQFFFGGVHVSEVDDADDTFFNPQSSTSNAGEFARRANQPPWIVFGNATFTLPGTVQLSGNFNSTAGSRYNITTGFDNNGDGNFNDRPQYAAPGTPGAIQTPFGLLVSTGGAGVFPRNSGVMPWVLYLDTNLQRTFKITRNAKAEHQQTLTANLRSSNVLNHTNVTSVGGVLGSPLFGVPFAADNGRRVEIGLRYSF